MATVSSIGTVGRNYATHALWLLSFAAGGWEGEEYNDTEFLVTTPISFSGHGTSAPNYIKLSAAAGQGFRDNANALTNALKYNVTNGAGIRSATNYINVISVAESFVTLFGLQVKHSSAGGGGQRPINMSGAPSSCVLDSCILELVTASAGQPVVQWQVGTITNCLLIQRSATGNGLNFNYPTGTPSATNCTIVRPSDVTASGNGIQSSTGAWKAVNCAVFGFTTFNSGGTPTSCSNNASDVAIGIGSSNQASKTYTAQFQGTLNASSDFRAKAGADLLENATSTGAPALDIVGTSRPQGSLYDIGCWELASGNVPTNITLTQKSWNWSPQLLTVDGKTFSTLIQKSWNWTPQLIQIGGTTTVTLTSKIWNWTPQLLITDDKSFITLIQKSWNWNVQLLTVDSKSFITLIQKSWLWGTQLLSFNSKVFITLVTKTWFWTGNQLPNFGSSVTPLLMLMGMGV